MHERFRKVMPRDSRPFETSYWVVKGKLIAGPHPGGIFEPAPPNIDQLFFNCGVRHFVDLTEEGEYEAYIPTWGKVDGRPARTVFTYQQFPIKDFGIPSPEFAKKILDYIDAKQTSGNGAVYVHCFAGLGRTGTIVGIYLARHGIATGEGVAKKIRALRASLQNSPQYYDSPQSSVQYSMIRDWKTGE